jgi:hypothetical protein
MSQLPDVERAVVYTPQPGDVVILETTVNVTAEQATILKHLAEERFGNGVRVVVLAGATFAGIVRPLEAA